MPKTPTLFFLFFTLLRSGKSNGMQRVPDEVWNLPNLYHIDLSFNSLRDVPQSLFDNSPTLLTVDLSHNLLSTVPSSICSSGMLYDL